MKHALIDSGCFPSYRSDVPKPVADCTDYLRTCFNKGGIQNTLN